MQELIEIMGLKDESDIIRARIRVKNISEILGFKYMDQTRIATAVSELARNAIKFAGKGEIKIRKIGNSRRGLEITIEDNGPGIENLELALKGGYSTSGGLGIGLSGAKKLVDEFDIDTFPGKGTKIVIKKWL